LDSPAETQEMATCPIPHGLHHSYFDMLAKKVPEGKSNFITAPDFMIIAKFGFSFRKRQ
jgi:hypothetical protein